MLADAARRAAAHEEPSDSTGSYRLHATEVPGPAGWWSCRRRCTTRPATPARPARARPA
ncbi:hypothetical protein STENM223S_03353 [Streptomyces tendae]